MTVLGIDVSKWQPNFDWQRAYDVGVKFASIRAGSIDNTTGKCYTDYEWERNIMLAPSFIPVGAYWYFRPNWSVLSQANYFADLLKDAPCKIPPTIDVEVELANITPNEYADRITRFLMYIMQSLSISKCIIYTRELMWDKCVSARPFLAAQDLWAARYNEYIDGPWADGKFKFRDWNTWVFWQYTSHGDGLYYGTTEASLNIDLERFNGDLDDLTIYTGGTIVDPRSVWMTEADKFIRTLGYDGPTPFGE